jgi:hypothetical protein
MTKKSSGQLQEKTPVKKPKGEKIDLDILGGIAESYRGRVAAEAETHIQEIGEVHKTKLSEGMPENREGRAKLATAPSFNNVLDQEEKLRRRKEKLRKNRTQKNEDGDADSNNLPKALPEEKIADQIPPEELSPESLANKNKALKVMEGVITESYLKTNPKRQSFEEILKENLDAEVNAKRKDMDEEKKEGKDTVEKIDELRDLRSYVESHRKSIVEKLENENQTQRPNIDKINELERRMASADYRIKMLNKAGLAFSKPNKENSLTDEERAEAKEVRDDVRKKIASELHELLLFVDDHRNSLIDQIKKETNKSKMSEIQRKIDLAEYRIKTLDRARLYYLDPETEKKLTIMERMEAQSVRIEVLNRIKEEKRGNIVIAPKEAKQKQEVSQSIRVEKKEEAPTKESLEKEDALRVEIQKIFGEKIKEASLMVSTSRPLYIQQIKTKTRHDHTQTNRSSLLSRLLGRSSEKKPSENIAKYEETKAGYEENLNILKNILTDEKLIGEALKKASELGDSGLQILEEEKIKLQEILQRILITEAGAIIDAVGESLPEKDRKIVASLERLYKKNEGNSLLDLKPIIDIGQNINNDNAQENAA